MEAMVRHLESEVARLKDRLKAADDVVSYLVIFGSAPTDRLAELVARRMEQRQRDKETLCVPSAVREAITPNAGSDASASSPIASTGIVGEGRE